MNYQYQTLHFPKDYDGEVTATLIKAKSEAASQRAVLYVHGYIDYFFQDHLAEAFVKQGYNFYAVDLRKYGRSLLEGQHPNYCRSLREYYPELTRAIEVIKSEDNEALVLLGHSTGGLLATLYANDGLLRTKIDCVVLNSPFFEFNTTAFNRKIAIPLAVSISYFLPFLAKKSELSPLYAQSVHKDYRGEWLFDKKLKPIEGIPLYFAWLGAIRKGQQQLQKGVSLQMPVLVMSSDASCFETQWSRCFTEKDTVLNVKDIERLSAKLGAQVEYRAIKGGMHDLFLSKEPVRTEAFRVMFQWLNQKVAK